MLRYAVVVVLATSGCALVEDFDHYSARHGERDAALEDVVDSTLDDTSIDDTNLEDSIAPIDSSAPVDTGVPCGAGKLDCGGGCIDVTADREHCGSCSPCEAQGYKGAAACVAGKCTCRAGATRCGDTCTYVDSDPVNCKSCGNKLKDATTICGSGCVPPLRECRDWAYGDCPVTCVDTASEGNHCYEYDGSTTRYVRCWGSNAGACVNNFCKGVCSGTGRRECTAPFFSTTDITVKSCPDTLHDPNHCGGCSVRCVAGEVCAEGTCKRYRPARSTSDCTASEEHYTPPSWGFSVCVPK